VSNLIRPGRRRLLIEEGTTDTVRNPALAHLGVTNTLALLRLLPMSAWDKDAQILALRHQITVLERQLHGQRVRFMWADRTGREAHVDPSRVATQPAPMQKANGYSKDDRSPAADAARIAR
jgi:hypothetical protein